MLGEGIFVAAMLLLLTGDDEDKPGRAPGGGGTGGGGTGGDKPGRAPGGGGTKPPGGGPVGPGGTEPERPAFNLPSVLDDYPTDGAMYQVKQGDMLLGNSSQGGIAHRAIAQRVFVTLTNRGAAQGDALTRASQLAATHRGAYMQAIQGHPFNDQAYATYGYGPGAMPNPTTKRALRLLPMHAPNRERLANNTPAIRSIKVSTIQNGNQGTGTTAPGAPGGNLELLVLPPIDGAALVDNNTLVVDRKWMPPGLAGLGIIDRSNAPASIKWGA